MSQTIRTAVSEGNIQKYNAFKIIDYSYDSKSNLSVTHIRNPT